MAAPTLEEFKVLKKFREVISDVKDSKTFSDMYCLSWLRARDLDITKANEMLRESLVWRKEEDIDNLVNWEPPLNYLTDYNYEIIGKDNEERPILILPFGVWDIRKTVTAGEVKTFLRHVDQMFFKIFEKGEISLKNLEKGTQFILIADIANFSKRQLTSIKNVNTILSVVNRFESNYPETMYACYLLNTSRIFSILFSIVKPLLSGRTLSKVQLFTTPDTWKSFLLEKIPNDLLPIEFGGSRNGRRISAGIDYTSHGDRSLTQKLSTSYITVEVRAGKQFELAFSVTQPQTQIKWTFETENYDIGFSINFNRTEEVLPLKKCDAHLNEETGHFICKKIGDYFVVFDNTYSKIRGKVVHYWIEIIEPECN